MLKNMIPILQLQDVLWIFGLFVVILATIIQKLPVKFNPWTYLLQQLGKTANSEIIKKQEKMEQMFTDSCCNINDKINSIDQRINETNEKVNSIDERLDKSFEEIYEEKAIGARRRILTFANKLQRNDRYSRECFDGVMDDIKKYKNYCRTHKDFSNDKAVISIEIIDETYKECMKNNSFLKMKEVSK